ncbi:3-(cis-5,6-dihydroxycyclohexa-1,3-dien-1-yl)propanoate dehydrogenase [Haliea sp.]
MKKSKQSQLNGRRILVTGGSSGLGFALVKRFLEEGAKVGLMANSSNKLKALDKEIIDECVVVEGDVTDLSANNRAVDACVEKFGGLDVFVGNAGIWDFMQSLADLEDEKIEGAFDEIFSVNVKGYLLGAKAALPALVRSSGTMIFTLSNAAFYVAGGGPIYTASKHAGVGLVKQLAYELAPRVRVNGVAVGPFDSELRGPNALDQNNRSIREVPLAEFAPDILPISRLPQASDYCGAYVLLASETDSMPITGSVIEAHGGMGVRGFPRPGGGYDLLEKYSKSS